MALGGGDVEKKQLGLGRLDYRHGPLPCLGSLGVSWGSQGLARPLSPGAGEHMKACHTSGTGPAVPSIWMFLDLCLDSVCLSCRITYQQQADQGFGLPLCGPAPLPSYP